MQRAKVFWYAADFRAIAAELTRRNADLTPVELHRAQQILPVDRRMSKNAFYSDSAKPGGRLHTGLLQAIEFNSLASEVQARKAEATVQPTQPTQMGFDEATLRRVVREEMLTLLEQLFGPLHAPPQGPAGAPAGAAQGPAGAPIAGAPVGAAQGPAGPPTGHAAKPAAPRAPRIDIVGLLPDQMRVVRQCLPGKFRYRCMSAEESLKVVEFATTVVLCTKFISHTAQARIKNLSGNVIYANGAAESVVQKLMRL